MNDLEVANISEKPSLEYLIQKAILKVNGKNEASICRFIPFKSGGYTRSASKAPKANRFESSQIE